MTNRMTRAAGFDTTFLDSNMQYAHMHHPTPKSLSSLGARRFVPRGGPRQRLSFETENPDEEDDDDDDNADVHVLSKMIRTPTSVAASRLTLPVSVCKII